MSSRQAEDVAIICAETGCRQSEIYNLPARDIFLDAEIPHFRLRHVPTGTQRRELKNGASVRAVPLLGAALEAMKRNPQGFTDYRGKGGFSGTVNSYLQRNDLMPQRKDVEGKFYTLGATRHTFEERARAAKIDNEGGAFLMGHSVGKVRGRPVYGIGPQLKLRALLYELVAFPTPAWTTRAHAKIWEQIDAELEDEGFRVQ